MRSGLRARAYGYSGATVTITAADGRKTKASKGSVFNWGGDSKGGLMGGIGKSYHFNLMLASCCRNGGGKSLGVNTKDATDDDDTIGN